MTDWHAPPAASSAEAAESRGELLFAEKIKIYLIEMLKKQTLYPN